VWKRLVLSVAFNRGGKKDGKKGGKRNADRSLSFF
jgi:hypothetical protein